MPLSAIPDETEPLLALAKLTPKELDCLDRWLQHATAKEIARDLKISHHAVEKRLKSARLKLGVSTSLEAARLAAQRPGYQRSASQSPDLDTRAEPGQISTPSSSWMAVKWRYPIMISVSVALIAALATSQTAQDIDPEALSGALERTMEQEVAMANSVFNRMDTDESGALEENEFVTPFSGLLNGNANDERAIVAIRRDDLSAIRLDEVEAGSVSWQQDEAFVERRRTMFTLLDRNEDGQIDRAEFADGQLEGIGPRMFTIELPAEAL